LPGFEDGRQELPGSFDAVVAGKEGLVAEHTIQQQSLVGFGQTYAEDVLVIMFSVSMQIFEPGRLA
jgi:hypothetical protein